MDSPLQPVRELFTRSVSALWATTYNVDLRLVSEFLLPALGMPPLNVTVLADGRHLGRSLARVGADTGHLARVNRRWLLRGVRPPGPTFHPKSYLSVAGRQATLLVGSGNLSVPGLEEGREVFTAFRSGNAAGDRAIAAWRSWMRRVLAWSDDPVLAERFADLESRLPPPVREAPQAQDPVLLHNLDVALLTQLTTVLPRGGVDELHLCAPFYDRDLAAVTQLLPGPAAASRHGLRRRHDQRRRARVAPRPRRAARAVPRIRSGRVHKTGTPEQGIDHTFVLYAGPSRHP
jgi:hypothetical protein